MEETVNAFNDLASTQSEYIIESLTQKECITSVVAEEAALQAAEDLPPIDIFINPARKPELTSLADSLVKSAADFFTNSDMRLLYPQLFRVLWQSTLPCVAGNGVEHCMIRSYYYSRECQLGGKQVPCEQFFTKVPTDSGRT